MMVLARFKGIVAAVAVASALVLGGAPAEAQERPASFADLAARLSPAVVNISTTQKVSGPSMDMPDMPQFPPGSPFEDFFKDFTDRNGGSQSRQVTSLGSGFVIDADKGLIVTNNHVIADADQITVILADNKNLKAELVGRDAKLDIAVLRVPTGEHTLTAVSFGDSDAARVGDWVLAIGNPFGMSGTVTAGIISARARDIHAGPYDDFIQSDAAINRGNSGGPMFNLNGEVIGINTAIFSPTGGSIGIGFAIPANLAKPIIAQLVEFGRTKRGWIGVRIQSINEELAETLALPSADGALVASVTKDSPAEKAGLQPGDVILTFDGKSITAMRNLPRIVAETPIGKAVPVELIRKGERQTMSLTVAELEAAEKDGRIPGEEEGARTDTGTGSSITGLGLTVAPLSDALKQKFELEDDASGLVVTAVKPNSVAAEKGLEAGVVVMEADQQPLESTQQLTEIVAAARKASHKSVLLLIDRKGDQTFLALPLQSKED